MTGIRSDYARIIQNSRVTYMPSCLVVEMMTRMYSQISVMNLSGNLHNVTPDILILLRRLTRNLRATVDAHRQARIQHFIGGWKDDKARARRMLFNLMSRLGFITELLDPMEKGLIYKAVEELTSEWSHLDALMEQSCGRIAHGKDSCRFTRGQAPNNWQHILANVLLTHSEKDARREPGAYLLMVCYNKIKMSLLRLVDDMEKRAGASRKLEPDSILSISREDIPISCPQCTLMTDAIQRGGSDVIRRNYRPKAERKTARRDFPGGEKWRRRVMPPSLAGITGGDE